MRFRSWWRTGKAFVALIVAAACSMSTQASPVTYFVDFSGAGTRPALGVFTYDASVETFSNFFVFWNDTLFDLTAEANAPIVESGCPGETSSAATSFALLNHGLCAGTTYAWLGNASLLDQQFEFFAGGAQPNRQLLIAEFFVPNPGSDFANGFGDWSLTNGIAGDFNYVVNFMGAGTLPGLGIFSYDATAQAFDNFFVLWNNTLFDLTAEANAPIVESGCPGETSSAATSFALLNHGLCAGTTYAWLGNASLLDQQFEFFAGGAQPNRQLLIAEFFVPNPESDFANGFGDWTLTQVSGPGGGPVSEPDGVAIVLAGLLALLAARSNRPLRPAVAQRVVIVT